MQKNRFDHNREGSLSDHIPYTVQIDRNTVKTKAGDYLQVIRLEGIAHESADAEDVFLWRDQLNMLIRSIASPRIALWIHTIRREQNRFPSGNFQPGFCNSLNEKYRSHLSKNRMMVNELYVSVIFRSPSKTKNIMSFLDKSNKEQAALDQHEAIEQISEVVTNFKSGLTLYTPSILSTYERSGVLFSEVLEFLGFLVNGEWQRIPVTRTTIADAIVTTRPFFGTDVFELRSPTETTYGGIIAIKDYPESTGPGLINALLSAPYPLILAQSFSFISQAVAVEMMKRQQSRMINAGDLAESQIASINEALDDLVSGRFVMGEHHFVLTIFSDNKKTLKNNIGGARSAVGESGILVAREDLALEAAYWSQLPGNFSYRPRPAPITSRNAAGFASFHNYPSGQRAGNQWGPAVTLLQTTSGTPYYFNFHERLDSAKKLAEDAPDDHIDEGSQQKALANTVIIGPSGGGKTVVQAFALAQAQKYSPTSFIFDKDRGLEIFVRAIGGTYLPLQTGKPTGFNPFTLEPTERNMLFLEALVKKLVEGDDGYRPSIVEEKEIASGVRGVMNLRPESRRLGRVLEFMDNTDKEGAGARLEKWTGNGTLAWVFDSGVEDKLDFDSNRTFGFDVTDFLDNPLVRTPTVMYLFHRMEELIDGRRFICFLDEFWKLLLDKFFEDFAQNKLKVIRKQNGFLVMGTQSPRDVLGSPIAHSEVV